MVTFINRKMALSIKSFLYILLNHVWLFVGFYFLRVIFSVLMRRVRPGCDVAGSPRVVFRVFSRGPAGREPPKIHALPTPT